MRGFPEPAVEFRLLGPFEVAVGGEPAEIGSAKQRALLVMLCLELNRVVSVDRLADGLWSGSPPPSARSTLQSLVSRIRQVLSSSEQAARCVSLKAQAGGYLLEADPEAVDSHHFERLMARARARVAAGELERAAADFEVALTLWRGRALAGFADHDFARIEAARLEEARLTVTEDLAETVLALGRADDALAVLQPFVAAHPLRERAWGNLMLALYRLGRQAEALRAYQTARRTLVDELGVEPSPALRRLEERILVHGGELEPGAAPTVARHNLPSPLTPFVGRDRELADLERVQHTTRLLTITGAGGVGKTRLALQLTLNVLDAFPDGAWLVDLAPLVDAGQVAFEVAAALGVATGGVGTRPGALERRLAEQLRPRRAVLLLDNCEHLVPAVAALVEPLLRACPDLAVVATSRELLGVTGEAAWRVPALSLPPAGATGPEALAASDAVALLCARAPGDFALSASNAPAVATICRRLDGIPLAVELAAARLRHLSAEQVAGRLDDRFRLLESPARIATARHQTLRSAIDWSYDLLPGPEQALFRRVAVFPAGFDLEAAQAIADDGAGALDGVAQLVDKSLLGVESLEPRARYRLLETIRAYGLERLREAGEEEAVRRRHADYYRSLIRPAHDAWFCGALWAEQPLSARSDYEHYRAALEWFLVVGDPEGALSLAGGLWAYWLLNGLDLEGADWLDRALALPSPGPSVAHVESLLGAAILSASSGRRTAREARVVAEAGLQLAVDLGGPVVPRAHAVLSELALLSGDREQARALGEEALSGCEALGMTAGTGWCHQRLGWVAMAGGDLASARGHFEQAAHVGRAAKDLLTAAGLTAHGLAALAPLVAAIGNGDEARALAAEAVEAARELPLYQVLVMALVRAAETALLVGDPAGAEPALREALDLLGTAGGRAWVADVVEKSAMVQAARGRPESAARLLGACAALRAALGERPSEHRCIAGAARRAEEQVAAGLGPERLAAERSTGHRVALAEAVAFALSELGERTAPATG